MSDRWKGTPCFGGRVVVVTGDITAAPVDAIVNAANSTLLGGGGVDGAIHRAGGPAILEECRSIRKTRYPDGLPTGEAVITTAGRLTARWVIHTVGPVWHGGSTGEPELLQSCYRKSLDIARERNLESIAFPAISTGVYGYPKDGAATVVSDTLRDYCAAHTSPGLIYLVFFSESDTSRFLDTAGCR